MALLPELRTIEVQRYVQSMRSTRRGVCLPALVATDDGELYVLKPLENIPSLPLVRRGRYTWGVRPRALLAELLAGELARRVGILLPEFVLCRLNAEFTVPNTPAECCRWLTTADNLHLAIQYLPGAQKFVADKFSISTTTASLIVWCDCLTLNFDRLPRNPNLLICQEKLWAIDYGEALHSSHPGPNWWQADSRIHPQFKHHVLLPWATDLLAAGQLGRGHLGPDSIQALVALLPESWLRAADPLTTPEVQRTQYADFLLQRLAQSNLFE